MGTLCAYKMISFRKKKKFLYTRRENTGVGGMITLVWILKKQAERAYIDLAQNREKWWILVSMVIVHL